MAEAQENVELEDKDVLLKQASVALEKEHRRHEATKLAFVMVEKGKIQPFETYDALEEKVASLMEKDLRVVREALDLDVELPEFGKLAGGPSIPEDATAAFYHRLAED